MVISTDSLFSLKFIGLDNQEIAITNFCDQRENLVDSDTAPLVITENRDFRVKFSCSDPAARLEMDGFDGIYNAAIAHGDERYLGPGENVVTLFAYDNFPLPPGRYILTITCYGKSYYKSFLIIANALKRQDNGQSPSEEAADKIWQQMWITVLGAISGRAFDYGLVRKQSSNLDSGEESFNLFWKIGVIEQYAKQVVTALTDIANNPHAIVKKKYLYTSEIKEAKRDFKAIKLNKKHKVNNKLVVPVTELNYDLIENQHLKRMVKRLLELLETFEQETKARLTELAAELKDLQYFQSQSRKDKAKVNYTEKLKYKQKVKAALEKKLSQVEEMKNNIGKIQHAEWFKALKETNGDNVSGQSFKDPRYHTIYTLYERLKSISAFFSNNRQLALVCKHSCLLYEYWNVINLVQLLVKEHYTLLAADHAQQLKDRVEFKDLRSGDSFIFFNPNKHLKIKLYYEPTLPVLKRNGKTYYNIRNLCTPKEILHKTNHRNNPLYTVGFHNTPDCVMNFYLTTPRAYEEKTKEELVETERFVGSLVIDFKYRSRKSFWENNNKCRMQLNSYKAQIRTLYGNGEDVPSDFKDIVGLNIAPVKEIWALYPNMGNFAAKNKEPSEDLSLISVVPGETSQLLESFREFVRRW